MIKKTYYHITLHNNLILVESFGAWDVTIAKECLNDIVKIVLRHYANEPYAIIEDARKWELNTPDSMNFWKKVFDRRYYHFPTHVAYVVGESELKHWAIERMLDDSLPFKTNLFSELHDALTWLEPFGYFIAKH